MQNICFYKDNNEYIDIYDINNEFSKGNNLDDSAGIVLIEDVNINCDE